MLPALSKVLHGGTSMSIHSKVEIFEGRTSSDRSFEDSYLRYGGTISGGGRVSEEFKKRRKKENSNSTPPVFSLEIARHRYRLR